MKNLKVLKKYIVKYKWHLLLGILFVFLSNYFKVLQPQMIREALDTVLSNVKAYQSTSDPIVKKQIYDIVSAAVLKFALLVIGLACLMGILL